jgi:hypothetical protein
VTFGKEQNNFISLPEKLYEEKPAGFENTGVLGD